MAPLTDWEEALEAADKLTNTDYGEDEYLRLVDCVNDALLAGQKAEAALERAIEHLCVARCPITPETRACYGGDVEPRSSCAATMGFTDCQACWRSFLTKEAK